jgi:hypothetical protein
MKKGCCSPYEIGIPARTLAMHSKHRLGQDAVGLLADNVVCLGNRCFNMF